MEPENKDKSLTETSSIRNTVHAAGPANQTDSSENLHGIATTYFLWHLPVSLRYANRKANHIFLSLVCHGHVTSTRVFALCSQLHQCLRDSASRRVPCSFVLSLLLFTLKVLTATEKHTGCKEMHMSEKYEFMDLPVFSWFSLLKNNYLTSSWKPVPNNKALHCCVWWCISLPHHKGHFIRIHDISQ